MEHFELGHVTEFTKVFTAVSAMVAWHHSSVALKPLSPSIRCAVTIKATTVRLVANLYTTLLVNGKHILQRLSAVFATYRYGTLFELRFKCRSLLPRHQYFCDCLELQIVAAYFRFEV